MNEMAHARQELSRISILPEKEREREMNVRRADVRPL